jgi:hypothetical protein
MPKRGQRNRVSPSLQQGKSASKKRPSWLEPVEPLVPFVTSVGQARTVLATLSAHLGDALEQRDALLDYLAEHNAPAAKRERLPGPPYAAGEITTRNSRVFKLRIGAKGLPGHVSCHLFLGFYPDGRLGELFVQLGREHRSDLAGGGFHWGAKMASLALQHGAPPEVVLRQMRYDRDASGGRPHDAEGPLKGLTGVTSLTDYLGVVIERALEDK